MWHVQPGSAVTGELWTLVFAHACERLSQNLRAAYACTGVLCTQVCEVIYIAMLVCGAICLLPHAVAVCYGPVQHSLE